MSIIHISCRVCTIPLLCNHYQALLNIDVIELDILSVSFSLHHRAAAAAAAAYVVIYKIHYDPFHNIGLLCQVAGRFSAGGLAYIHRNCCSILARYLLYIHRVRALPVTPVFCFVLSFRLVIIKLMDTGCCCDDVVLMLKNYRF